jgi:predicted DCC family thiol-disulfide oxidoreductase YuxK
MKKPVLLIYDKQCPACDFYCNIVRIQESVGELILIDARENSAVMDEITAKGWDVDQGMVVKIEDKFYYGSDAIHILSSIGSESDIFNRLNYWLFRSEKRATFLYPILRSLRNLLLKLLAKTKINNLNIEDNNKF